MCIFCGGTCGGVGDSLLPLIAAGAPIVIMKIRCDLQARKLKNQKEPADNIELNESPNPENLENS